MSAERDTTAPLIVEPPARRRFDLRKPGSYTIIVRGHATKQCPDCGTWCAVIGGEMSCLWCHKIHRDVGVNTTAGVAWERVDRTVRIGGCA